MQLARTMAVVAEPPLVAEVSTQDAMAGVAVPHTFVDATTAVTAEMSMEAATEVDTLPSAAAKND